MKKIPDELKSDIEDAATAGLLGNLPAVVAEKDQHITDALRVLAQIQMTHTAQQRDRRKGDTRPASIPLATRLIFAGGTCLSKAYGLIERMSEDIDIKVMLEEVPEGYALPKGDRGRLKDLQREVERCLTEMGFEHVLHDDNENPVLRDSRRYYCLLISYGAHFQDVSGVLRPQLKLELIHRPPMLAAEKREMGYMLDQFVPREVPDRFSMTCITVAETLAEKVLSLLRRCAWNWDGNQRGEFDTALVRHVYDVWRIAGSQPDAIEPACQIFEALVQKDVEEFKGQHPEFDQAPYAVLRRSLATAATHEGLKMNFEQRLKPLLYAVDKPDFQTCFVAFAAVAERLLNQNQLG
ncbi:MULTISPECIES: nucleotidyl transferase AbiEii/AbiGii toxin family protein [unclassified Pseudomonas]|uniref:nucleotidyl transferase AbiEii/AbiGii toxin family protein n=2 Tax=unclassified Pseudomonas TaxID=196821 RepID=UPI0011A87F13|nr:MULTISPECIES: nucleotidyl transferase AbiEii/AbiGii toxin family protein [unclassified Pseudomonas]TWC20452.1 nucleotidyltransferase AbiEii toxin of type IV toxin-antitoxin system [Pseudomonas sp. SJZ075]TWC35882.1 nucleotidyltransferase AbiEii toxin of type IV toxin-antitoxin system [Pseudomonas sp. SJZ078]TWC56750.1 nucleotidyltransferase AbiEii toxin of type IV toxin-antitoxin system [Pseudomonas sp. SJZ124]TWC91959.1 nucleotidyltransferase AbiEii toxin of type IV toxin-antitoxin system [